MRLNCSGGKASGVLAGISGANQIGVGLAFPLPDSFAAPAVTSATMPLATYHCRRVACALGIPLLMVASPPVSPQDQLGATARYHVPMSCAALALIRGADYPEVVRVYDEGHEPRDFAEADRAGLGLMWRHRQQFAEDVAVQAFKELYGKPPSEDELRAERSKWVHKLMSYPEPLREAVATNCEALFEVADRSCPTPPGAGR